MSRAIELVAVLYLLLFPGLFGLGCLHWYRVRRRYDRFLEATGLFPQPTFDDMVEDGPIRTTLFAIKSSDEADRQVRVGTFGSAPQDLLRQEVQARFLAAALLLIGFVGVFALTPILANVSSSTGASTDMITVVTLTWVFAIGIGISMLRTIVQNRRNPERRALVIAYGMAFVVVVLSAFVATTRLLSR